MKELNPMIRKISEHYCFRIDYCDTLNHWTIRGGQMLCEFYWTSSQTEQEFLDELSTFWQDVGAEKSHH